MLEIRHVSPRSAWIEPIILLAGKLALRCQTIEEGRRSTKLRIPAGSSWPCGAHGRSARPSPEHCLGLPCSRATTREVNGKCLAFSARTGVPAGNAALLKYLILVSSICFRIVRKAFIVDGAECDGCGISL